MNVDILRQSIPFLSVILYKTLHVRSACTDAYF